LTASDTSLPFRLGRGARLIGWLRRVGLGRKLALGLTFAALASGMATYVALTGSPPFGPNPRTLLFLVILDLCLLLPLAVLVAQRVVRLWSERRRGQAGSRLHARLVLLFGLLATTPAVIVAVFSALFFNFGIQAWFGDRVRTALSESLAVTQAYVSDKYDAARAEVLGLADEINRNAAQLTAEPRALAPLLAYHARDRGIEGALIFDARGRTLANHGVAAIADPVRDLLTRVADLKDGEVRLYSDAAAGKIKGITKLLLYYDSDVYLFVERPVDTALFGHVRNLREAVDEYERLKEQRSSLQFSFYLLFAGVSLLLVLAAIWLGFMIANQLARPISELITAAERVGTGDLRVRVDERRSADELGSLSRSFNRMIGQLQRNREELVEANRQLDARREFTETVLAGVGAGVVGLDAQGRINLPNRSATELLGLPLGERIGQPFAPLVPELAPLLAQARARPERMHSAEIQVQRPDRKATFLVRVAAEEIKGEIVGFVVTFDDISELQAAQRKAAWADVARRIAHEIKNPLTPIQLSAERLRRKYLGQIVGDREAFEQYTETIVRQVGDIGRLVDEFSAFARMPVPVLRPGDLAEVCRQAVFLERTGWPDIEFVLAMPEPPLVVECDQRLVGQALLNLLRNAAAAINERGARPGAPAGAKLGRIEVTLTAAGDAVTIVVSDDGKGLPAELKDRLTEPYVTTRAKGTGLGLAIARKIMEDHGGSIRLENRAEGGARVALTLPRRAAKVGLAAVAPERAAE
jgi:two-component system nitrogen regulation sensor histidine kinase NtrY